MAARVETGATQAATVVAVVTCAAGTAVPAGQTTGPVVKPPATVVLDALAKPSVPPVKVYAVLQRQGLMVPGVVAVAGVAAAPQVLPLNAGLHAPLLPAALGVSVNATAGFEPAVALTVPPISV